MTRLKQVLQVCYWYAVIENKKKLVCKRYAKPDYGFFPGIY